MNPLPNFHFAVPAPVLFGAMLVSVGLETFGDPAAFGAPSIATPLFKAFTAILSVALAVMVVAPAATPAAPGLPQPQTPTPSV